MTEAETQKAENLAWYQHKSIMKSKEISGKNESLSIKLLMRHSLLEVLSRVEIQFAICDKYSCRKKGALVAQINDLHFGKQRILAKINVITI